MAFLERRRLSCYPSFLRRFILKFYYYLNFTFGIFFAIFCFIISSLIHIAIFADLASTQSASLPPDPFYKEGYMNIKEGKIWYSVSTSKEAQNNTPLLIIHGGPGSTHDYLNNLKALRIDRPVIFYDQLGSGKSTVTKSNKEFWQTARFIEELSQIIDFLELKDVILLGHSWGGALAAEYTLKYPLKVKKLILASPLLSAKIWEADAQKLVGQLPADIKNAILAGQNLPNNGTMSFNNSLDFYYGQHLCRILPWPNDLQYSLDNVNREIYQTMWGSHDLIATGNLKNFDVFSRLDGIKIPVLLTGGQYDEVTPDTIEKARKRILNSDFMIFQKSAHMPHLEEETAYFKAVSEFLKK